MSGHSSSEIRPDSEEEPKKCFSNKPELLDRLTYSIMSLLIMALVLNVRARVFNVAGKINIFSLVIRAAFLFELALTHLPSGSETKAYFLYTIS